MSFRLTDPMSQFMNEVILNENRIRTDKPSKKNIQYIIEKSTSSEYIRIVNDDYLDNMGAWTSQFVYRQMKEMGY